MWHKVTSNTHTELYTYIYIYYTCVCVYTEGNSACIQIVSSLFRSRKNLYTGVTLCGTGTLVQPLPLPPLRQPAGQCVLNYNYLCMTKGHETCLMTHLPQSRTKRAAADAKIHRVRQEQHSRGKGQRRGRAEQAGTSGCSACLPCLPAWMGYSTLRAVDIGCAVVYGYN